LTEFVGVSPGFDLLGSLAPPGPGFAGGLDPDYESLRSPLSDLVGSFSSCPWGSGQDSGFVRGVRSLVLEVPKFAKKGCPRHIDMNGRNGALNLLVRSMGHLAVYLSLKDWPFYSLPHLQISRHSSRVARSE